MKTAYFVAFFLLFAFTSQAQPQVKRDVYPQRGANVPMHSPVDGDVTTHQRHRAMQRKHRATQQIIQNNFYSDTQPSINNIYNRYHRSVYGNTRVRSYYPPHAFGHQIYVPHGTISRQLNRGRGKSRSSVSIQLGAQ